MRMPCAPVNRIASISVATCVASNCPNGKPDLGAGTFGIAPWVKQPCTESIARAVDRM
jgi:hypothetical protein